MKFLAAFVLLLAGISALPQELNAERNVVSDQIVAAIEDISERIQAYGLDPLYVKREAGYYELPVPVIFNGGGYIEDVLSTGLSNIVINEVNYDIIGFRVNFDLELPKIHVSLGDAAGEVVIFDNKLSGRTYGSGDINNLRVKGSIRVSIIGGISAQSITIDVTLGSVDSNIVTFNIQGHELADRANTLISETIPEVLNEFKAEVDELLEIVLLDLINEHILGKVVV